MNPNAVGGEFYFWELARGLAGLGHKVTLICSSFDGCKSTEIKDDVEIIRVKRTWSLSFKIFTEYMRIARSNYDMVVEEAIGGQRLPFFGAIYIKKPLISVWHQRNEKIFFEQYPFLIAVSLSIFERFLAILYRNHTILTPSEGAKQKLLPLGFRKGKIQVIYDGVGATFEKVETNKIRGNTIVCLGKMRRYKRIDHTILALPKIISKVKEPCKLIVAGKVSEIDKGYLEWMVKLSRDLGVSKNVDFRINISESQKLEILSHAKVLVQPSPIEGFSIVVVEANRCGTPVVASDGVPTDVLIDGYNGFSYPFGQINNLSNRVVELLCDKPLWHKMSSNSKKWSEQFTWAQSALEFEQLINKLKEETLQDNRFSKEKKLKLRGKKPDKYSKKLF
jgi:glycosyltransferase involved in cell wall biosynthesis